MKRRRFFQTIAAAPAASALFGQQPPSGLGAPADELPKLETTLPDSVAEMTPHFFNAQQMSTLRKLSELLMPPINGAPGAREAHAPEFLDFLLAQSPNDRQQLYRAGLDTLTSQSHTRFNKPFADLDPAQAGALLAPLSAPWTYEPPADPLSRFLHAAKQDVRTATMNSREYGAALGGNTRRGLGGGLYWNPID